jgi:hypothetical protein
VNDHCSTALSCLATLARRWGDALSVIDVSGSRNRILAAGNAGRVIGNAVDACIGGEDSTVKRMRLAGKTELRCNEDLEAVAEIRFGVLECEMRALVP